MMSEPMYRGLVISRRTNNVYPFYIICPNWYEALSITTVVDSHGGRFRPFRSYEEAEREFRQYLGDRIETLIRNRDEVRLWACLKNCRLQRKDFDTALKLIRGGIDLNDVRILNVINDLGGYAIVEDFNTQPGGGRAACLSTATEPRN